MTNELETGRLHFVDAIRTWAILMMLQGHFVAALLSDVYRDKTNLFYSLWSYFRGMTAPVFFTVSGFIFTFLLIKKNNLGWSNPRVKRGIKRGFQLIVIGYVLQIRFLRLFKGTINSSYNIVHVLQCLGLSIILIVLLYLASFKFKKQVFPTILFLITVLLFVFKVEYEQWNYSFMPELFSNYFTKANGSVFTIIPWFGFSSFGAFLAVLFASYHKNPNFYRNAILLMVTGGLILTTNSHRIIGLIKTIMCFELSHEAFSSNYLFIRLGDVLLVFSFFMGIRFYLNSPTILRVGQKTLSIYIIHSIVLYGSITGYGLTRFFYHSLSPILVILGALLFMVCASLTVLVSIKRIG